MIFDTSLFICSRKKLLGEKNLEIKIFQIIVCTVVLGIPLVYCNYDFYSSLLGFNSNDCFLAISLISEFLSTFETRDIIWHQVMIVLIASLFVIFYVLFIPSGFALIILFLIFMYDLITRDRGSDQLL